MPTKRTMPSDTSRALAPATSPDVGRGTASPNTWGLGDGQQIPWEYAPAPEARDIVQLKSRYGLFIGGRGAAPPRGEGFSTVDSAPGGPLGGVGRAAGGGRDQGGGGWGRRVRRG